MPMNTAEILTTDYTDDTDGLTRCVVFISSVSSVLSVVDSSAPSPFPESRTTDYTDHADDLSSGGRFPEIPSVSSVLSVVLQERRAS